MSPVAQQLATQLELLSVNERAEIVLSLLKSLNLDCAVIAQGKPSSGETYETRTPIERAEAFLGWVDSHRGDTAPLLSDEAISRESIYE